MSIDEIVEQLGARFLKDRREAISQPFVFELELVSERPDLDLESLLHQAAFLAFSPAGNGIHGLVYRVAQGESGQRLSRYHISLRPQLSYLAHRSNQRIFQQLTVAQIIGQVLEEHGIQADAYHFQLGSIYPERDYCVQYDESDLHFVQRLCEEEGIHYHFQHSTDGHVLVFGDDQTPFPKLAPTAYQQDSGLVARQYTLDTPLEAWVKHTRFGTRPAEWAGSYEQSMTEFYKIVFPISFQAYRLNELNPYRGMQTITYLLLRLPGKDSLSDEMIHFKGTEIWGGLFGLGGARKPVEWTGKDFDRHGGTRVKLPPNEAVYRRVYHEEDGRVLNAISGELSYSPIEGLTLPAIEIKELAWL